MKDTVFSSLEAKLGPQKKKEKKAVQVEKKEEKEVVVEDPKTPFEFIRVHNAHEFVGKRVLVKGEASNPS